jgi:hypothetical protein
MQSNGQGAVSTEAYLAELPSLIDEISFGRLTMVARPVSRRDVESNWDEPDVAGRRTVIVP